MDLKDLYRDVILDHNKRPRNFGRLDPCDTAADGYNPLCGDQLTVTLRLEGDRVEDIRFEGRGCGVQGRGCRRCRRRLPRRHRHHPHCSRHRHGSDWQHSR